MARCLYNSDFASFLYTDSASIYRILDDNYHGEALTTTRDAWKAEIEIMKTNWDMTTMMFENVVPQIEVGMTERHIGGLFEGEMMKLGAESYVQSFAPMVATGPVNSHISMSRNTLRKISESEMINLAAGVSYEGYNGIICSPLVLGKIPQEIKAAVNCAYDALNYASAKMEPGVFNRVVEVNTNAGIFYITVRGNSVEK